MKPVDLPSDSRSSFVPPSASGSTTTIFSISARSSSPEDSQAVDETPHIALLVIAHPDRSQLGHRFILEGDGPFEIGRADTAEIRFAEVQTVSRRHARIRRHQDRIVIEDLGTRNGTFVNDRQIRGALELHSGDRFQVGSVHMKCLHQFDVEYAYHEHINAMLTSGASERRPSVFESPSTEPPASSHRGLGLPRSVEDNSRIWLPQLVSIGLLLVALDRGNPYQYYTLLRWVCTACFTYLAFKALSRNRPAWAWIFGVVAVLYNPVWPLHLTRQLWNFINLASIAFAAASLGALAPRAPRRQ